MLGSLDLGAAGDFVAGVLVRVVVVVRVWVDSRDKI